VSSVSDPVDTPSLKISTLGGLNILVGEKPVSGLTSRKVQALLVYLARTARPHTREVLAELLWFERAPERALANLRGVLHGLRKHLDPFISITRETVAANLEAIWLDANELDEAVAILSQPGTSLNADSAARAAEALTLYQGEFLLGFPTGDSRGFEDWLLLERERLQRKVLEALFRLGDWDLEHGEYSTAIEQTALLLQLDPWNEPAHRAMMRLLAYTGQRGAALEQYGACRQTLADELGVDPAVETTTLYEQIRKGELATPDTQPLTSKPNTVTLPEVGDLLNDRYRLDEQIGVGGMGTVYRAKDTLIRRDVAIKVISASTLGEEAQARIMREAQTAGQLNHPNIVSVYDAGEVAGSPYVVMELIEGETLWERRERPFEELLLLLIQVCDALGYAHAKAVIHRDLKPDNVMILSGQTAKLMDFSLARSLGASRLTATGSLTGTVAYLAPEIALGRKATPQSDLYAVGVMLYELVTGRLPFDSDDPLAVVSQHIHAPLVPPSTYNAEIPAVLEKAILKLLSKTPEERFESAKKLQAVFENMQASPAADTAVAVEVSRASTGPGGQLQLLERIVRGRLIGRQEQLAELKNFWDRAARGESHLVLISGEPGVGKSRLARELSVYASLGGGQVLTGQFQPEMDITYLGFREAMRVYLRSSSPDEVKLNVEPVATELVKLLPEMAEMFEEVGSNPHIDGMGEERLRMFDYMTRFLTGIAAAAPVLLVLEDLHWADGSSLEFLHYLLRNLQGAPLLVLGTYREVSLDPERPFYEKLLGLNRERLYTRIPLRRLNADCVHKMLEVLLDGPVNGELADQIYAETQGNPFFVEEVVKSLIGRNALRRQDNLWQPEEGMDLHVPQSIQVAIGKRITRLSEDARDLLTRAAVQGHVFNVDVLQSVLDWDEDRVLDALEEAENAQLIHDSEGGDDEHYHFEHALTAQVLYEGINLRRRSRLHHQTGDAIETVFARKIDDMVEKLAHHYALASQRAAEKTIMYGLRAAEKAASVYAHEQTLSHYGVVLDTLEDLNDSAQSARVWELVGDINSKLRDAQGAVHAYENALKLVVETGSKDSVDYFRIAFRLGEWLYYVDLSRSRDLLEEILSNTALPSDSLLRAQVMSELVIHLVDEGSLDEAFEIAEEALGLVKNGEDPKALANAWRALGQVHQARHDREAYHEAVEGQLSALSACEDYFGIFGVFYYAIRFYFSQGEINEVERMALNGLSFCQRTNAPGWRATILAAYLGVLYLQGRWAEAQDHAQTVLPLYQQKGIKWCFLHIFSRLGQIEAGKGNQAKAQEYADTVLNLLLQLVDMDISSDDFLVWQLIALASNERWEEAWRVIEEAQSRDFNPRARISGGRFKWAIFAPLVAAKVGKAREAEEMARSTLAYMREGNDPYGIAFSLYSLGMALEKQQRWDEALESFEQALKGFEALGFSWDAANTRFEIGRLYAARAEDNDMHAARKQLEEAKKTFEQIGAAPHIEATQATLEMIGA
jgi:DNA-binding SARP family transcriptional activator